MRVPRGREGEAGASRFDEAGRRMAGAKADRCQITTVNPTFKISLHMGETAYLLR
jgi:hypothetical protein